MAQATVREVVIVTLELTKDEALAVKALVGNVIGRGKWRDATTAVFEALDEVFPQDDGPELLPNVRFSEDL